MYAIAFSSLAFSQVGINTPSPASTLDVTAKNSTGNSTNVDGLLVPRVDRQRAQSMSNIPVSTLIYVNSIATGSANGITANIDAIGYYYFDGSVWTKLKASSNPASNVNIYTTDGSLQGNRTVSQGTNTLSFTPTVTNGFSVDGSTFSIDGVNHRLGVNTTAPSTKLDIRGDVASTAGVIKIADGNQGSNKVLMSDANGVGTWNSLPGSWFGLLYGGSTNTQPSQINFTTATLIGQGGNANIGTGAITTPSTSLYEVTISGYTIPEATLSRDLYGTTWIIKKNGTDISYPFYASPTGIYGTETSVTNYYMFNAGDVITLFLGNPYNIAQPSTSAKRVAFAVKLIK